MQSSDIPVKFQNPFAVSAGSGYKRQVPNTTADANAASLTQGFPPNTFLPIGAGGAPPDGRDFNGLLNQITAWNQWQQTGGPVGYDATFSTEIGGYPKGAVIASATFGKSWLSTAENNVTDPDTGGAGWVLYTAAAPTLGFLNLVGSAAGGTKTAIWTVDQITAATALNGVPYFGSVLTFNFNGAGTGANGMDTGSVPSGGDLYIYAIYNPLTSTWATLGTIAGNGAQIYGGSNLPAGYTASCLLWSGKTNSSNIIGFIQRDRNVLIFIITVVNNGAAVTPAGGTTDISAVVPVNAKEISGSFGIPTGAGSLYLMGNTSQFGAFVVSCTSSGLFTGATYSGVILYVPQTLYYYIDGTARGNVLISGYTI